MKTEMTKACSLRIKKQIRNKIVSYFRSCRENGERINSEVLCSLISNDVSYFFPRGDYDLGMNIVGGGSFRVMSVYNHDRNRLFLYENYCEKMRELVRGLTHGFFKLRLLSCLHSKESSVGTGSEWIRLERLERFSRRGFGFGIYPYEVKRSYLVRSGIFHFSTCSDEICLLKKRLATAIDGSSPSFEVEGLQSAIRYLEGFAAEDSEERGLSYCLRFHEDFDTPDKYQAWSPGYVPFHITNGRGDITFCTAAVLEPRSKHFDCHPRILCNLGDSFLEDFDSVV